MLRYLYNEHEVVAAFVAQLIPHCRERGFGPCKAIGVIDDEGRLIGGIVYHHFDPESEVIEISGAATTPRWLTRDTIRRMYQYPFLQLRCQMIVQRTPASNERLLRQLADYGYTFIAVPRMFGRHDDGVLCLLTDDDWRANRFNQRFRHHLLDDAFAKEAA